MEFKEHYKKPFYAKNITQASSGTAKALQSGFLIEAGVHSGDIIKTAAPFTLGPAVIGLFDAQNGLSVTAASPTITDGKMCYLAQSSWMPYDQLGTHGGYQESYKSRMINPRFITKLAVVECAAPEQSVCHLGNTNFTRTTSLTITNAGAGYTDGVYSGIPVTGGAGTGMTVNVTVVGGEVVAVEDAFIGSAYVATNVVTLGTIPATPAPTTAATFTITDYGACNYSFYCGETYNLQIAIGGPAVLSAINHEVPRWVTANGGCCPEDGVRKQIDSTLIFIQWAQNVIENPYFKHFIRPVVYTQAGIPLFATAAEAVAAGYAATNIWSTYVSPGYIAGSLGGIRFNGAYFDTKFNTCSFTLSDSIGAIEPIRIIDMAIVDNEMNVCSNTLCFVCEHPGYVGQGYGHDVIREFISDIPRRGTNYTECPRMREIEGVDEIFKYLSDTKRYTRVIIQHYIPHFENNATTHSDIHYELNLYFDCGSTLTSLIALLRAWTGAVENNLAIKTYGHIPFVPVAI